VYSVHDEPNGEFPLASSPRETRVPTRAPHAEALLRALVGIADACVLGDARGGLAEVSVLPAAGANERQAARNASSALLAAFGIRVPAEHIRVIDASGLARLHGAAETRLAANGAPPAPQANPRPAPRTAVQPRATDTPRADGTPTLHTNKNGNGRPHGSADESVTPSQAPSRVAEPEAASPAPVQPAVSDERLLPPAVEAVELRRMGDKVRCLVTVSARGARFAGAGEGAANDTATLIALVARVTVEALRANVAATNAVQFDGASVVELGGRPHVLVALRTTRADDVPLLAGAAAATDGFENAAARATLGALRDLL
jgi:hypothetical protein